MKGLLTSVMLSVGFLMAAGAQAQAPATAPAGSTALCKDGSYVSNDTKKGACRGHKGVKDWYGASGAAAAGRETAAQPETKASRRASKKKMAEAGAATTGAAAVTGAAAMPAKSGASMPMTPPAAAPTAMPAPMPNHAPKSAATNPESRAAAPGGGNGKVWVNDESKVYHCADDRYYGKTKKGEYMSEAEAVAKGAHASHGKACSAK